jgi:ABC-type microcin C transport system permease subunit YejE|tara:strand:+ start:87 stop:473 length:387 start_codon:yes stop_codon:yes gene_type:complete
MKKYFEKKFGEGTAFDLDYGKLLIIALLIYIAFFKSASSAIWQDKPIMCASKDEILMALDERSEIVRFYAMQETKVWDGEDLKEQPVSLKLAIFVNSETKTYSIVEAHPTYKTFCVVSYGENFKEVNK